jgi:hypothetical protein
MTKMNKFIQFINPNDPERQKARVVEFIQTLPTSAGERWEVTVKTHKKSKTLEQLRYYYGVVVPVVMEDQGLTKHQADEWLKNECCEPTHIEVLGKVFEIRPSISKMKVNEMSSYIDDCINYLGLHGIPVPAPEYRDWHFEV